MTSNISHKVANMPYKLTVEINENSRRYTDILKRRLRFKNKDELIEFLIEEKTAQLFSYA